MKLEDNPRTISLSFYFLPSHRSEFTSPLEVMVCRDDKQRAGPRMGRDDKHNVDDMGGCFSSSQQLSRVEGHSLFSPCDPLASVPVTLSLHWSWLYGSVIAIVDVWQCPTEGWASLLDT